MEHLADLFYTYPPNVLYFDEINVYFIFFLLEIYTECSSKMYSHLKFSYKRISPNIDTARERVGENGGGGGRLPRPGPAMQLIYCLRHLRLG